MTREKKAKEENGDENRCQQLPNWQTKFPFQQDINQKADGTPDTIIDCPDWNKIIAGLALVGIPAAGAAIKRRKPVAQLPHPVQRNEDRADSASRTAQPHRAAKIAPSGGPGARLLHTERIRRRFSGAKRGLIYLEQG